jgi:PST family polysaccharide transporter
MVAPIIGFVQLLADFGLLQAVVQRPNLTEEQLSSVFWINVGLGGVLTFLLMLLAPLLAWMYGEPRVLPITIALGGLVMVAALGMVPAALLNRRMQFGALAITDTCSLFAGVVVGVLCAWQGWGVWSLVISQAVNSFTSVILAWIFSNWRPLFSRRAPEAAAIIRFGGNVTIANIAGYLNFTFGNVMIAMVLGEVALGLYDRAWKFAVQPFSLITAPITRIAVPVLSRLFHSNERYRRSFVQMLQVMLLAISPAVLWAMFMAKPLILLSLGPRWSETIPIFSWILLGVLITPLNTSISWLFISQGRSREQMMMSVVTAVITISAYAVGLVWGLKGVAQISTLSVWLLQTPLLVWTVTREGSVNLRTLLTAIYPFGIMCIGVAVVLDYLVSEFSGLIGLLLSFLASYVIAISVVALTRSGRAALLSAWNMRTAFIG